MGLLTKDLFSQDYMQN